MSLYESPSLHLPFWLSDHGPHESYGTTRQREYSSSSSIGYVLVGFKCVFVKSRLVEARSRPVSPRSSHLHTCAKVLGTQWHIHRVLAFTKVHL
uniref:Uncharacterized protein n=1 Tax=Arundo donax TaxID=35708 RepID=A0A0A9CDZ2_ARUDO